jgi:hypothetical protein
MVCKSAPWFRECRSRKGWSDDWKTNRRPSKRSRPIRKSECHPGSCRPRFPYTESVACKSERHLPDSTPRVHQTERRFSKTSRRLCKSGSDVHESNCRSRKWKSDVGKSERRARKIAFDDDETHRHFCKPSVDARNSSVEAPNSSVDVHKTSSAIHDSPSDVCEIRAPERCSRRHVGETKGSP